MERVRMFLSPSGTLGMKYWVRWALLVRVVRLEGSLMPVEVPMENVGITAGRPKHPVPTRGGRSAGGSRVCTSPDASPGKEAGVGEVVMRKSS